MRRGTIVQHFALRLALLLTAGLPAVGGCAAEKELSPWGPRKTPSLKAFLEKPDLDEHVRAIEEEARAAKLELVAADSVRARDGTVFEVRAFRGVDGLGHPTTAVRVASPFGVVLAVGPRSERDASHPATELVLSLASEEGTAVQLPADLLRDGSLLLALRSDRGTVEVHRLTPHGSGPIAIELAHPVSELRSQDGAFMLACSTPIRGGRLERVAAYDGKAFRETTDRARAWHAREARRRDRVPREETAEQKLARLAERAFHRALSEPKPSEAALRDLVGEVKAGAGDDPGHVVDSLASELGLSQSPKGLGGP